MRYLPVNLDLDGACCVVVGGGEVAARKVALLRRAGAAVRVVAPELGHTLAARTDITWLAEAFAPGALDEARLVVAATDDEAVNAAVAEAARARGLWVNVVDAPALCSFTMPSIIDRDPLLVAVSSAGSAPVLATATRERIEALLPRELGEVAKFMGARRTQVKAALPAPAARRAFWRKFLRSEVPALLARAPAAAQAAFEALLAAPQAPLRRVSEIRLASPAPEDLTLGALALLSDADCVCHTADVPPAILDYARRDAEFILVDPRHPPTAAHGEGHTVHVSLIAKGGQP